MPDIVDTHITGHVLWDSPAEIKGELPLDSKIEGMVYESRSSLMRIMRGTVKLFPIIAGPCSIHEEESALDFAERFNRTTRIYRPEVLSMMRTCFEKPRTKTLPNVWAGGIMDPDLKLDGSHDFNVGIRNARRLLREIIKSGMPVAMEIMDPNVLPYLDDLLTYIWTGARNVLVPANRRMASGVSMPVGFKNGLDGNIGSALDAIESATHPNYFAGIHAETGRMATFDGKGNPNAFLILRGGEHGPNIDAASINHTVAELEKRRLNQFFLIDASHGNSRKDPDKQVIGFDVAIQFYRHMKLQVGVMVEAYIEGGNQPANKQPLTPGLSITDACMSWPKFEELLKRNLPLL